MSYSSDLEIHNFVESFNTRSLPKSLWTHDAHLIVALWHVYHYSLYESLCFLKSRIITYNEAVGGVNSPTGGYHETLTVFWLKIVNAFVNENKGTPLYHLCNDFLKSDLAVKDLPFLYYSKELLFSATARATWIEPDLKKLTS